MPYEFPMPCIRAVGTALPPHYADQETLTAALRELWTEEKLNVALFDRVHKAVKVSGRHLSLPIAEYRALDSFAKCNQAWVRIAPQLGEAAVRDALDRTRLSPSDIDHLFFVTVTGIATPSIDTRLANSLRMRPDMKRTPIFGLGCVAGAAAIARASDYLRAFPGEIAAVVAVELCSLTLQREDLSIANIIASGLFGDGAAAVIIEGGAPRDCAGPRVIATRAVLYPNTEHVMGWEIVNTGFKVILTAEVPAVVRKHLRGDVDAFLAEHRLNRSRIRHWIAHTGGPRVLEAFEQTLELPPGALDRSWNSLDRTGNLSSASVLFVLEDLLRADVAKPGDYGMLVAMGPGFCSELVLLRW